MAARRIVVTCKLHATGGDLGNLDPCGHTPSGARGHAPGADGGADAIARVGRRGGAFSCAGRRARADGLSAAHGAVGRSPAGRRPRSMGNSGAPPVDDPMLAPVPPPRRVISSWAEAQDLLRQRSTNLKTALDQVLAGRRPDDRRPRAVPAVARRVRGRQLGAPGLRQRHVHASAPHEDHGPARHRRARVQRRAHPQHAHRSRSPSRRTSSTCRSSTRSASTS